MNASAALDAAPRRATLAGWLPVAVLLALACVPWLVDGYQQDLIVKIQILAIFALSLELLVGTGGLVSLGHAAFLGIGAYAVVLASPQDAGGPAFGLLALSMLCAAAYALFVGALSLRTRGVYFIMVTLAFAQMAYFVFHDTKFGGGSDGVFLYVKPSATFAGLTLDLDDRRSFYYLVLACLAFTSPRPTGCSRCCCARASAMRWRASASTSSACARRAFAPTATSSRPSSSAARWPGWPASCSR